MTKFLTKVCTSSFLIKIVGLLAYLTLLVLVVITYDHGPLTQTPAYIFDQPPVATKLY